MLRTLTKRKLLASARFGTTGRWPLPGAICHCSQHKHVQWRSFSSKNGSDDGAKNSRQLRDFIRRPAFPLAFLFIIIVPIIAWEKEGFGWGSQLKTTPFGAPKFTPFTIVDKEEISPSIFILTVRPGLSDQPYNYKPNLYEKEWARGTWAVEFKQPQLQIARSYTPLPPFLSHQNVEGSIHNTSESTRTDDSKGENLRFLIRKEPGGEVSNYLASLPVGGKVELRGPHPGVDLPSHVTDVVFLAGGTGIAPAMQVIYTLLQNNKASTAKLPRISIVWANRKRESCIGGGRKPGKKDPIKAPAATTLVKELDWLERKFPDNLKVQYLVDEESDVLNQKQISALIKNNTPGKSGSVTTRIDSKLIFVSGPEGFVNYVAGPKKWENGKEIQGKLGGLLGQLSLREWKVWKH